MANYSYSIPKDSEFKKEIRLNETNNIGHFKSEPKAKWSTEIVYPNNESLYTRYAQINGSGRPEYFPLGTAVQCVGSSEFEYDREYMHNNSSRNDYSTSDFGPKEAASQAARKAAERATSQAYEERQKEFRRNFEHKSRYKHGYEYGYEPRFQVFNQETGEYEPVQETRTAKLAQRITDPKTLEWFGKQNLGKQQKIMDIINNMTYDDNDGPD